MLDKSTVGMPFIGRDLAVARDQSQDEPPPFPCGLCPWC